MNRTSNRLVFLIGSSLLVNEILILFRAFPDITVIGSLPGERVDRSLVFGRDIDDIPPFPKIRKVRDVSIPNIIHLKQPRHTTRTLRSVARPQDMRIAVPRTKPRKRNGSR